MYNNERIAAVIPCYRVEASIGRVVATMPEFVDVIIAVNDASPDSTAAVLDSIRNPRLVILTHQSNQGVGGAMASGFAKALELEADIVVKVDGDGQMDPDFMVNLVDPVARDICDYAKGNRFLHRAELEAMPFMRLLGNISLTFLTKISSGYWHVFDPQNGYVAIKSEFLELLDMKRIRTRRYFFENEMLIRLNIESARVLDVPIPSIYAGEVSSLRISKIISYFPYFLMKGFFSRLFHRYIMRDFSIVIPLYLLGTIFVLWGVFFGGHVWIRSARTGIPQTTGTVMLAVMPFILGVQMLLQGLMFDIIQSPKPQNFHARYRRTRNGRGRQSSDEMPTGPDENTNL